MRHVNLIVIILELDLESQGIIETTTFLFQTVLEVADVLAITVPSNALAIIGLCHFFGVDEGLHALIVRTFRLYKIDKVKFVSCKFLGICNFKIVPLGISCGVMIILKY